MRRLPGPLLKHLTTPADGRTDGDLLAGFLGGTAETDFAELVRRHGPMVWGVCRRVLPDTADAEDAFQATFLVLVRKAGRLVGRATVGPWLHQVAVWTARNTRRRNARRLAKREPLPEQLPAAAADPDLHIDLDAALLALPEKFRSPIVLCHLLGFSRADAAERLGCPEGTLSAWLSRGLAKLKTRLGGLDPAKALAVGAVPAAVSASAVRAAVASPAAAGVVVVSSTVTELVKGVVHMFWVKKATAASVALVAVFAMGVGVGVSTRQMPAADGQVRGTTGGPAAADPLAAEIAKATEELEAKLRAIEDGRATAAKATQRLKERIDSLKAQGADPKRLEAALDELARAEQDADKAAAEVKLLKAKLDALRSLKTKTADPQPWPKTDLREKEREKGVKEPARDPNPRGFVPSEANLRDIDRMLADLKRQFDLLAAERLQLEEMARHTQRKAAELDQRARELKRAADELAARRADLAGGKEPAAGQGGAALELTVRGARAAEPFALKETGADGKDLGRVTTADPAMLRKVLARTFADSTAPKELRVAIQEGATLEQVKVALEVARAAGFTQVKVTGAVPPGLGTPAKEERGPAR